MLSPTTFSTDRFFKLLLFLIIVMTFGIRARLASMPLERDEGEYAYMGQQILAGIPPYKEAFAMKFPGIYLAYSGIFITLGQTDTAIRWGTLLMNIATAVIVFLIAKNFSATHPVRQMMPNRLARSQSQAQ